MHDRLTFGAVLRKSALNRARPEIFSDELFEVPNRQCTAHIVRAGSLVSGHHLDKRTRLPPLKHTRAAHERQAYEQQRVHPEAPDHPMGQRITEFEVEQRPGSQKLQPGRARHQEAFREPAARGKRRQQQGISPDHATRAQPSQRPDPRRPGPENAAKNSRRELRHSGKGNQPDRGQGLTVPGDSVIGKGQQQDRGHRKAPDVQQRRSHIPGMSVSPPPVAQE